MARIIIGEVSGSGFNGTADLTVAKHATRVDNRGNVIDRGYFIGRKRLVDREAFNRNPCDGWELDHWFEWTSAQLDGATT